MSEKITGPKAKRAGSQTLLRGLDVLEALSDRTLTLSELSAKLGLTRSTTHRIAMTLSERRYIKFVPREGYSLGAKLLHLGAVAHSATDLVQLARPYLKRLSLLSGDTVCLGVLDGWRTLYMDRVPGRRTIDVITRVGERQPVTSTGLGKALILNSSIDRWREFFQYEVSQGRVDAASLSSWLSSMADYARRGYAFDLEESRDQVRCVAAPVFSAKGKVVAAISIASASQYMDDLRIRRLSVDVRRVAGEISQELGWICESGDAEPARMNPVKEA